MEEVEAEKGVGMSVAMKIAEETLLGILTKLRVFHYPLVFLVRGWREVSVGLTLRVRFLAVVTIREFLGLSGDGW